MKDIKSEDAMKEIEKAEIQLRNAKFELGYGRKWGADVFIKGAIWILENVTKNQ